MINELASGLAERSPYLVFPAMFLLLAFLAFAFKTYPSPRAVLLFSVAVLVSLLRFVFEDSFSAALAYTVDFLTVGVLLADWFSVLPVGRGVTARRTTEEVVALLQPRDVELVLTNSSKRRVVFDAVDDSSPFATATPPLEDVDALIRPDVREEVFVGGNAAYFGRRTLAAGKSESLKYRLRWNRRGVFRLEFVALRFSGIFNCWRKYKKTPCVSTFRVYPNLGQPPRQEIFARRNQALARGVRRIRRVGQDTEFERLREYTRDDQFKFIDWKATARCGKLIVRDFEATRNQRVIIALDAGRMTMNRSRGITLFDYALNSSLTLAHIALRQGDEVGILVFSDDVIAFIPPRGGASHMNAIVRGVFDVFPERVEARYDRAFAYLKRYSSKRALVVLATSVLDQRNADQIQSCMTGLVGEYLPLALFFREHSLFDPVERFDEFETGVRRSGTEPTKSAPSRSSNKLSFWLKQYREADPVDELERLFRYDAPRAPENPEDQFFQAGAASQILNWRGRAIADLEARGVLALDIFPEDATAPLVNKYLEIKARKLL